MGFWSGKEMSTPTQPHHLENATIRRVTERYTGHSGDGLRGSWSEGMMSFVKDAEIWNAEELIKYASIP